MDYRESHEWLRSQIMAAVASWWEAAVQNPHADLRCYYKPGSVVIAAESPGQGYELFPERISPMHSRDSLFGWLWDRLRSVPCLPPA